MFAPPAGTAALDEVSGDGTVAAGVGTVGEAVTEALTDGDGAGLDGAGLGTPSAWRVGNPVFSTWRSVHKPLCVTQSNKTTF